MHAVTLQSEMSAFPVVVVGAGITGCTIAERVASELSLPVLVLERRPFIGGNSRASIDPATGIEVHHYGSHIFHTMDERVWRHANKFTSFNAYRHKVLLRSAGRVYSMPVNLKTLNDFYEAQFSPEEARAALQLAPGVVVVDDPRSNRYPMPIDCSGKDPVYVGRIRVDTSSDNGLTFWLCGDQIKKCAALNAVQIGQYLIAHRKK